MKPEEDPSGPPAHCSRCKKFVKDGEGVQVERPGPDERFCFPCWKTQCDVLLF